jgi:pilus assembly protein CpaE
MKIVVAENADRQLEALARTAGLAVASTVSVADLQSFDRLAGSQVDILVIDVRGRLTLPVEVQMLKRRHPKLGILLVAAQLEQTMMLEAMRAGVTDVITDPVSAETLKAAVQRLVGQFQPKVSGQVFGFIGAKGGVGTTTLAVNVAATLASSQPSQVALVDLHVTTHGDASLLLGVEPRFSVVDALDNIYRLDEAFLKGLVVRTDAGLDLLAAPENLSIRLPDHQHVQPLLERLAEVYRWVVLDVPRSDLALIDKLEPITAMTLVVNQELPAVRRAAQIAALLRTRYGAEKVGLVISRFEPGAEIREEDIRKTVGSPVWGVLPNDYKRVVAAANLGRPWASDNHNRLSGVVRELATRLTGAPASDKGKSPAKKLGKIAGIF